MSCVSDHVADTGVVRAGVALERAALQRVMAPWVNRCKSLALGIEFAQAALDGVARRCGRLTRIARVRATRPSDGLTQRAPSSRTGHSARGCLDLGLWTLDLGPLGTLGRPANLRITSANRWPRNRSRCISTPGRLRGYRANRPIGLLLPHPLMGPTPTGWLNHLRAGLSDRPSRSQPHRSWTGYRTATGPQRPRTHRITDEDLENGLRYLVMT